MKDGVLVTSVVTLTAALSAIGLAQGTKSDVKAAWIAWEDGAIARAQALAREALAARPGSDEARHLLVLTAFVSGDYPGALDHYRSIHPSYRRLKELTNLVIEAYVHQGAIAEALAFARGRKDVPVLTVQRLEEHARRPLEITLSGVAALPFADHPLGEWLPAFSAAINRQALTAHVDTGGSFLHMGPERARALGIKIVKYGTERAHLNRTRVAVSYGIAERFELGDAVLHNVPVDVLETLTGDGDLVIFGTNLLERFLSTMDYPSRRLLLSKRGDPEAAAAHRALLPSDGVTVPFHLWGSHHMFARGGLGVRRDLNWFVDSGLVSVHPEAGGGTRQASFTSSKRRFAQWGISGADIGRGCFESPAPLMLGDLIEDRSLMVVGAVGDQRFGGVRIDGLISHAFLKRFVWTIDFDTHEYRFAERMP